MKRGSDGIPHTRPPLLCPHRDHRREKEEDERGEEDVVRTWCVLLFSVYLYCHWWPLGGPLLAAICEKLFGHLSLSPWPAHAGYHIYRERQRGKQAMLTLRQVGRQRLHVRKGTASCLRRADVSNGLKKEKQCHILCQRLSPKRPEEGEGLREGGYGETALILHNLMAALCLLRRPSWRWCLTSENRGNT